MALWYKQNLQIFANINLIERGKDRILVTIATQHFESLLTNETGAASSRS